MIKNKLKLAKKKSFTWLFNTNCLTLLLENKLAPSLAGIFGVDDELEPCEEALFVFKLVLASMLEMQVSIRRLTYCKLESLSFISWSSWPPLSYDLVLEISSSILVNSSFNSSKFSLKFIVVRKFSVMGD